MSVTTIMVYGYHGTSRERASIILRTREVVASANEYDWLGRGSYFWQDAPARAYDYARQPRVRRSLGTTEVTAIGTLIALPVGDCVDLLDILWSERVRAAFASLQEWRALFGEAVASQDPEAGRHPLDRAVLDHMVTLRLERGQRIRAVRATYREGEPLFKNSALYSRGHVQIAIRDETLLQILWEEAEP